MDPADITIWIAFAAGVLSFISPCTLPLYPAYLSYITGVSVTDIKINHTGKIRLQMMVHSILFLLGVSTIYMTLAWSASFIGVYFQTYQTLIQQISGVLIFIMGLFLLGVFKVDFLMREHRLQWTKRPVGYIGSIFIGMGFAAGWTPCIGPILTVILSLSLQDPASATNYMIMFILGFALPFFLLSFFISSTKWIIKYSDLIMKIGGGVMIIMGILLYTDRMIDIYIWINRLIEGTWLQRLG
ncbi:cytochrome c biogenesis CcdA family protein [Caldalkalibacillus salinus]|uniref:cytochrome c biogenesis CcdA family protein n=1 Tax=Caldalkalibacillus salinus TaxID=2803787 RepID=UPI001924992D|nr:cytochrome c biogenesis protein CcdA [Caldalkalibacillus salinus]